MAPRRPASTALAHVTVLDLTRVRAGPAAVRQLADWGADVIKIEMPEALEADGAVGAPRQSSDFQNLQRKKRSLTLNLKDPTGVAIFKRLAKRADVIVENFLAAPELLEIPEYATAAKRSQNRDALNAEINRRLRQRDCRTWLTLLTAAGIPCGEINAIDQVFADPQVKHLGAAQALSSPSGGQATLVGQPVTLTRTPSKLTMPSPERGEHSEEILGQLGYGSKEISDPKARNIM